MKLNLNTGFARTAVFLIALTLVLAGCHTAVQPDIGSTPATNDSITQLVFGAAQQIGGPASNAASPLLVQGQDGHLYMIWSQDDPQSAAAANVSGNTSGTSMGSSALRDVLMSISSNGGQTWSKPLQVNDKPAAIEADENPPKIAVASNGWIYSVWNFPNAKGDKMRGNAQFASFNGVGGFTPAQTLNDVKDVARFAALGISPDGTIFIPWIDRRVDNPAPRRIYHTRISASGKVLSTNVNIGGPACECCRLAMAFADGGKTVYIAYRENLNNIRDMVIQKSTDGGNTFGAPVVISNEGWYVESCPHSGPDIAVDAAGDVHVTWWTPGPKPEDAGIYYSVSQDGGQTFSPRKLIDAENGTGALRSYLSVGPGGNIYMAWSNIVPNADNTTQIFFRYLGSDGKTLSSVQQLSKSKGNADRPAVIVSNGKVYISWTETDGENSSAFLTMAPILK
ncbi:MAG: sialidase family protein [Dehalococcoidales bacterium]|nr:sialidase family protein [Dehalococcoidales bacterium]